MNKQEVYNKVAKHLLTQKKQAIRYDGTCVYRRETPTGEKLSCAVGCLLTDEAYSPSLENHTASDIEVVTALGLSGIIVNCQSDKQFLLELQYIHDRNQPIMWADKLMSFAVKHDLVAWKG